MELQPWLEVAIPRPDIADGSFDESLFAADLGLVARGSGPLDYRDPIAFCEKTYLTKNLEAVLVELGSRLAGDPAAAGVFRLQTEFGGGKTHTLLAAYHLFGSPDSVASTDLAKELSSLLPGGRVTQAKVVVLDGSALTVGSGDITDDGAELWTMLGYLAHGLGGKATWDTVADQDRNMLGSSTVKLAELLAAHTPCLILLDETLEYLNKGLTVQTHDGNLASTTLTFIKELTSAVANTPGAALLATLTSSRMEDYAEVAGQEMQERLSKIVGRAENIVTPVEGDDIFPILHRRLFTSNGGEEERRALANAYAEYYAGLGDALPSSYSERSFRDRLAAAYPFHPELVDILTNRWGSLSGFQRTRGALRTLAHTVKALSQRKTKQLMIQPGDMPLDDGGVRAEILRFAGDSFKAALNADIIRPDSKAVEEDQRRGGQVKEARLAVGLSTTAFLESFGPDKVLGASAAQLLLGVGRPSLSRGVIEDVRDALESQLWYMRLEGGRYRFTTEPNLNKVVLEREAAIGEDRIVALLREAISQVTPDFPPLRSVPWVHDSTDLLDEQRLTLGVLDFDWRLNEEGNQEAVATAQMILEQRGAAFRTNRNATMLVVADGHAIPKARAAARTLAALRDVGEDVPRLKRFNAEQREQLSKRLAAAEERLPQQVVMSYRHLALLGESSGKVALDVIDLGPARAGATIPERVLEYLRGADRLIDRLAPAALLSARFNLIAEDHHAVELASLAAWFFQLTRLPKLAGLEVLRACLADGVQQRVFGLASGSDWAAEDAVLRFGVGLDPSEVQFQLGTWLVRAGAIKELLTSRGAELVEAEGVPPTVGGDEAAEEGGEELIGKSGPGDTIRSVTVSVRRVPAEKARDVIKVAVLPLQAKSSGAEFDMVIRADGGQAGIPSDVLELTVREGLRQLGLDAEIRATMLRATDAIPVTTADLIKGGESSKVEFKESARWSYIRGEKEKTSANEVVRAICGLLNADGGTLLIGVRDDGTPVGLKADFKSIQGHPNSDGFLNWLTTLLRDRLGINALRHCRMTFEVLGEAELCRVDVAPSPEPVHVDLKDFYVRLQNTTQQLGGQETLEYVERHWSR
jgi:uncharacterized protein